MLPKTTLPVSQATDPIKVLIIVDFYFNIERT